MNSAVERFIATDTVRRSALMITVFAIMALLLQGFAEQGGIGSSLDPVPQQPLPFPRERIFGVDLSDRPSLNAVEWLESSGSSPFALALLRVDADIIAALRDEAQSASAFRALDQLMEAARDTNVALCLERPVTEIEDDVLAELTIDSLRDRYPDRIAYVTSCSPESDDSWATAIAAQVRAEQPASDGRLLPLSTGAIVETRPVLSFDDLRSSRLRTFAGSVYVLPIVPVDAPLSAPELDLAIGAIRDAAQIGLVLLQPDPNLDGAELTASLSADTLPTDQLPEGFSGVSAPALSFGEGWEVSTVGRVVYMRTGVTGTSIQTTFSGTTIYLHALLSPNAGSVSLWVDPDLNDPGPPDNTIDLSATQAQDAALPLVEGLAAAPHSIYLITNGGEVAISGLFVKGQPAAGWNAGLGAFALIGVATAAMAIVGLARVQDIRNQSALPPGRSAESSHPRAYQRDA